MKIWSSIIVYLVYILAVYHIFCVVYPLHKFHDMFGGFWYSTVTLKKNW